jgi:hypothetical protein
VVHERVVAAMERRDSDEARFALALDIRAAASWFRRHHFGDEAQSVPAPRRGARQGRSN